MGSYNSDNLHEDVFVLEKIGMKNTCVLLINKNQMLEKMGIMGDFVDIGEDEQWRTEIMR